MHVYYDPNNPGDATLNPVKSTFVYMLLVGIGMTVFGFGGIILGFFN